MQPKPHCIKIADAHWAALRVLGKRQDPPQSRSNMIIKLIKNAVIQAGGITDDDIQKSIPTGGTNE